MARGIKVNRRNAIAQDLRTSKYRKRVVNSRIKYNRKKEKHNGRDDPTQSNKG